MNKMNYLFNDCVSHRNTQRTQRNLEDFFDKQEKVYLDYYKSKHPNDPIFNRDEDYEDDDDDYYNDETDRWEPRKYIPINSWDDVLSMTKWNDQWEVIFNIPRRRKIHYKGYLYRKMSLTEFNKYLTGTLEPDTREWHKLNDYSYNIGYCFLGNHSIGVMNDWGDISLDEDIYEHKLFKPSLGRTLDHVGCGCRSYAYKEDGRHFRYQEAYCKFYYEGEIEQSIAYYGEFDRLDAYCENNYMIEYGLTDYSKLKLESVQINTRDGEMCGGCASKPYARVNC